MTVLRWVRGHLVVAAGAATLAYLMVPLVVVAVFSVNRPDGRFNLVWRRFSLEAWLDVCGTPGLCDSLRVSVWVGLVATLGATVLGTSLAFGLARYRFRGRGLVVLLVLLPLATPEVVMGASLLALFVQGGVDRGFGTLVVAHTLFCTSFVAVVVRARLRSMDPTLEEAAADLYATPWQVFWRVTFPLVRPGVVAAASLSFAVSFDDFVVSNFTSGGEVTFPMYVFGASQRALPPQVNVVGVALFLTAVSLVVASQYRPGRR